MPIEMGSANCTTSLNHDTNIGCDRGATNNVDTRRFHSCVCASYDTNIEHMSTVRVVALWLAIVSGVMCTFLDEGIIATAIPRITDEFHSLNDVGWYGSAYLLALCAFQLVYGRLYSQFNVKVVYLASLGIFEAGSVTCGASPSTMVLIVGRAMSGCGGAGLMSGTIALLANALPPSRLPLYVGAVGVVYGVASIFGPVVGGLITNSHLTWRWCFYINVPLAAPTAIATMLFVKVRTPCVHNGGPPGRSQTQKLLEIDWMGMALIIPSVTCLLLGLEFGSVRFGWKDERTIGTFVAFAVLVVLFVTEQWWMGEKALVPPRIMRMRLVAFGAIFTFCLESAFITLVYYIPFWLQAIQGVTPAQAGVRYLPLCGAFILSTFSSGWAVTKLGYFQPFMLLGTVLVSVGSGLLSTLDTAAGPEKWISYQVIAGLGIGASTEQPGVAVQSLLGEADAPIGLAVVLFCRNLGPAITLSLANSVFARTLLSETEPLQPLESTTISHSGATLLRGTVAEKDLAALLFAYNKALTLTFLIAAFLAAASIFGLGGIGWQRIQDNDEAAEGGRPNACGQNHITT